MPDPSPMLTRAPPGATGSAWYIDPRQREAVQRVIAALASPVTNIYEHASNLAQGRGDYGTELAGGLLGVAGLAVPEARGGKAALEAAESLVPSAQKLLNPAKGALADVGQGAEALAGLGSAGGGPAGIGGLAQAQRTAAQAAGSRQPLKGLPDKPIEIGGAGTGDWFIPGPVERLHQAAEQYARDSGIPYNPPKTYAQVDPARAKRIAAAFDAMPHAPDDPRVAASYDAMINETLAQYNAIKNTGLNVEFIRPGMKDPYGASPRLANKDLVENNHLWVFPTDTGFGSGGAEAEAAIRGNPLLRMTDERDANGQPMRANDVFRVVHDVFGHFKDGNGFRATGEENAWRSHSAMYSDLARPAMTSETRGQNSWVNFGPHAAANKNASAADTAYAPQKIGILPDWAINEGRGDLPAAGAAGATGGVSPVANQAATPAAVSVEDAIRALQAQ